MLKDEVREVVKRYLRKPDATDTEIARALGVSKTNFGNYKDVLTSIQEKSVKAWCFENYQDVAQLVPKAWSSPGLITGYKAEAGQTTLSCRNN